ncbi:heme ABC transporter ATP-binding protein [Streptomyces triticirhizae]|uniref:Heme ABC transporter ATP-binding protein n=1 Tax=Streptomyces triticirhizae TaxID=2483353 RepID=A0A3M2M1V4_9ACTN|nr:heme ABC transporter ATP-binding protein [Streptomyces triticirhizae]RMI43432.1 heme ABC transporter ATP-binding protein [Streptomyces triticirhizae]
MRVRTRPEDGTELAGNDGPWVVAEGVGFSVNGATLLRDVDLTLGPGSVVALVGPNGAGKSTLLGLVAGDHAPTAGRLLVGGLPPTAWRANALARNRSVMAQQHTAAFAFSVRELVTMGRIPHPPSPDDPGIVERALADADVAGLAERDTTTLSGGELARTAFARALAQTTPLVLLDEPTAALDLRHQEAVMRVATERAAEGACVVVVLHDLNLAARYADRVAMFADGRLVADGTPDEVLTEERIAEVYGQTVRVLRHPVSDQPLVVPV